MIFSTLLPKTTFFMFLDKGYGSQLHMDAIRQFGATKIHRRSYEPIRSMNLTPVEDRDNYLFEPENGKEDAGLKALLEDLRKH